MLVYCGQIVPWIEMKLGMPVGLGPGHILLDGDPAPLPQRGTSRPNFCPYLDGWIKMPLGMEVGLRPGHIVVGGDPAPSPQKGGTARKFSAHVCCAQTAGWIKMPLVWR